MLEKKQIKKRLIIALILLAAAVALGFLLRDLGKSTSEMWQRGVFCLASFGTGLGALLYLVSGWQGLLGGWGFVMMIFLPIALPEPFNRYFCLVFVALLFIVPFAAKQWKKKTGKTDNTKTELPEKVETEELTELPEDALFVRFSVSDRNYQLFRKAGQIIAYRVGGELRGIDKALAQDPRKPLRPVGKKDLVFPIDNTLCVQIIDRYNERLDQQEIVVKLKSGHHRHTLNAIGSGEQLRAFFSPYAQNHTAKKKKPLKKILGETDPNRVALLRKVHIGLCVFIGAVDLPWLFLDMPYRLFAALSLLPTLVFIALLCIFPRDTTLLETPKAERTRASLLQGFLFSAFTPAIRSFLDFDFLSWSRLFIVSGVLAVVLFGILLMFSTDWHSHISLLLFLPFFLLMYALGAVAQVNFMFDHAEPMVQFAVVEHMHIATSTKTPDSYDLTVLFPNGGTEELSVSKEFYQQTEIGDRVSIETYSGALGIPYAFVVEEEP